MNPTRAINVITLACLLFLTGCFGVTDDTITPEADGQTTISSNHAPIIELSELLNTAGMMNALASTTTNATSGNETLLGFDILLHHSAIDIDGDMMTMGWDIDLDGTIDVAVLHPSGFTSVYIPMNNWTSFAGLDSSGYLSDEGITEQSYFCHVAFIAIDSFGAGDASILEVIAEKEYENNSAVFYDFAADGAIEGEPSVNTDDSLVRITMNQGQEINWAAVSVKISIDDGAPLTCDKDSGDGSCNFVEFGTTDDQVWGVGDGITIYEQGQDLCDGSTTCKVDITITDTQAGKTIDTSSAVSS